MKIMRIPAEVFSRVSGYYRPVNQWNSGKQEEFRERQFAIINETEKGNECTDEVL